MKPPPNRFAKSARYEKLRIKAASSNERIIIAEITVLRQTTGATEGARFPDSSNRVSLSDFQGRADEFRFAARIPADVQAHV
jgi:hypothetical protein